MSIKTCEEYVVARVRKLEEQVEMREHEIDNLNSNLVQCESTIKELKDIVNSALELCTTSSGTTHFYRGEYVWEGGDMFSLIEKYFDKENDDEQE